MPGKLYFTEKSKMKIQKTYFILIFFSYFLFTFRPNFLFAQIQNTNQNRRNSIQLKSSQDNNGENSNLGLESKYAIVAPNSVLNDSAWTKVVHILEKRHKAIVISYNGNDLYSTKQKLSDVSPRYICFVSNPEYIIAYGSEHYVRDIYQLTRTLDDDIYGDAIWGILTGYNAADALRIASGPSKITVSNALLKTAGDWLDYFKQGTYFSESEYNKMWYKNPDGNVIKNIPGPTDCTDTLCTLLNSNKIDIMVTSGHASQYDWQLHYPTSGYEGFFRSSSSGQLYAVPNSGYIMNISSTNPKVYYAPGNCLIGNIANKNCMVLSWLHTGGAYQYAGYTVGTWYGYAGWGVSDYFIRLKNRFTFSESIFLNNQSLLYDLKNKTPGTDPSGLNYDKDVFAFYGDPACDARLENTTTIDPLYNQQLLIKSSNPDVDTVIFRITMNKSGHPSRHPAVIFPFRAQGIHVVSMNANDAAITDNFALLNIWEKGQPELKKGEEKTVIFTIAKIQTAVKDNFHRKLGNFTLYPNYPNPFNPSTKIRYFLQKPSQIKLTIFNVLGIPIQMLVNGWQTTGYHSVTWDGQDEQHHNVPSGIYICRLKAGKFITSRKMLLVR